MTCRICTTACPRCTSTPFPSTRFETPATTRGAGVAPAHRRAPSRRCTRHASGGRARRPGRGARVVVVARPAGPPRRPLGFVGHYAAADEAAGRVAAGARRGALASHGCALAVGPIDGTTWRSYRLVIEPGDRPPFFLEPQNPPDWPGPFSRRRLRRVGPLHLGARRADPTPSAGAPGDRGAPRTTTGLPLPRRSTSTPSTASCRMPLRRVALPASPATCSIRRSTRHNFTRQYAADPARRSIRACSPGRARQRYRWLRVRSARPARAGADGARCTPPSSRRSPCVPTTLAAGLGGVLTDRVPAHRAQDLGMTRIIHALMQETQRVAAHQPALRAHVPPLRPLLAVPGVNIATRLGERPAVSPTPRAIVDVWRRHVPAHLVRRARRRLGPRRRAPRRPGLPARGRGGAAAPHVAGALRGAHRGVPARARRRRARPSASRDACRRLARAISPLSGFIGGRKAHLLRMLHPPLRAAAVGRVARRLAAGRHPVGHSRGLTPLRRFGAVRARRARAHHLHQRQHRPAQGGGAIARLPAGPARASSPRTLELRPGRRRPDHPAGVRPGQPRLGRDERHARCRPADAGADRRRRR